MTRMEQELAHINKQFARYQNRNGEGALWYEWSGDESAGGDLFDEAGRVYEKPIGMALLWATEMEDPELNSREGRRPVSTLRGAFSVQTARRSGMSDPLDYARHLNDIVVYNGMFYSVSSYEVHGRIGRTDVIIGFTGKQIYPSEDMPFDVLPEVPDSMPLSRSFGRVNETTERYNYERPALRVHGMEGDIVGEDVLAIGWAEQV